MQANQCSICICCSCECFDYPLSIQDGAQSFTLKGMRECSICWIFLYAVFCIAVLYLYIFGTKLSITSRGPVSNIDYIDVHKLMT